MLPLNRLVKFRPRRPSGTRSSIRLCTSPVEKESSDDAGIGPLSLLQRRLAHLAVGGESGRHQNVRADSVSYDVRVFGAQVGGLLPQSGNCESQKENANPGHTDLTSLTSHSRSMIGGLT